MLYEKKFRSTSLKIGIALLLQFGLSNIFSTAIQPLLASLFYAVLSEQTAYYLSEVTYGFLYLIAFGLPALILRGITENKKDEKVSHKKLPFTSKLMLLFATIAVVFCFSQINALLVSHFPFYDYMQSTAIPSNPLDANGISLLIFTLVIVPALCEEFLFRATILRLLLPYSKSFAVIASAVCFGLMHRNPIQILYATAAGIALGIVYIKTGSYVWAFLTHLVNNLISATQTVLFANLNEALATRIFVVIEAGILLVGVISILILALREKAESNEIPPCETENEDTSSDIVDREVIFKNSMSLDEPPTSIPLQRRFFASPTVIIYLILCSIECILFLAFPGMSV